jgi:hypothetical protein
MFRKKKTPSAIDPQQLSLVEYAQATHRAKDMVSQAFAELAVSHFFRINSEPSF